MLLEFDFELISANTTEHRGLVEGGRAGLCPVKEPGDALLRCRVDGLVSGGVIICPKIRGSLAQSPQHEHVIEIYVLQSLRMFRYPRYEAFQIGSPFATGLVEVFSAYVNRY